MLIDWQESGREREKIGDRCKMTFEGVLSGLGILWQIRKFRRCQQVWSKYDHYFQGMTLQNCFELGKMGCNIKLSLFPLKVKMDSCRQTLQLIDYSQVFRLFGEFHEVMPLISALSRGATECNNCVLVDVLNNELVVKYLSNSRLSQHR